MSSSIIKSRSCRGPTQEPSTTAGGRGIKEKVLAARRVGIKRVIVPEENQKDLTELPEPVQKEMEFIFAEKIEDVLTAAIPQLGKQFAARRGVLGPQPTAR